MDALLEALRREQEATLDAALELALAALVRILGVRPDAERVMALCASASSQLRHPGQVRVKLAPADLALLKEAGIDPAALAPQAAEVMGGRRHDPGRLRLADGGGQPGRALATAGRGAGRSPVAGVSRARGDAMTAQALSACLRAIGTAALYARDGAVRQVSGLAVTCSGPDASLGELCRISPQAGGAGILAEVVGVRPDGVVLMPYGRLDGVAAGSRVTTAGVSDRVPVGPALLGRVVNAFGEALDDGPPIAAQAMVPLKPAPVNPLRRKPIDMPLETGVRAIDALLPLGQGQRVGILRAAAWAKHPAGHAGARRARGCERHRADW